MLSSDRKFQFTELKEAGFFSDIKVDSRIKTAAVDPVGGILSAEQEALFAEKVEAGNNDVVIEFEGQQFKAQRTSSPDPSVESFESTFEFDHDGTRYQVVQDEEGDCMVMDGIEVIGPCKVKTGSKKEAAIGLSVDDEIEFRLNMDLGEGSQYQEGDTVKGHISEVVDEGYVVKFYDDELDWIQHLSLLKDDPTIKKIGSKKVTAIQNGDLVIYNGEELMYEKSEDGSLIELLDEHGGSTGTEFEPEDFNRLLGSGQIKLAKKKTAESVPSLEIGSVVLMDDEKWTVDSIDGEDATLCNERTSRQVLVPDINSYLESGNITKISSVKTASNPGEDLDDLIREYMHDGLSIHDIAINILDNNSRDKKLMSYIEKEIGNEFNLRHYIEEGFFSNTDDGTNED